MKKVLAIFKNKWLIISLAALATIIGLLYFWFQRMPKKAKLPALPSLPSPKINQQPLKVKPQLEKLKKALDELPSEMPVYRIDSPKISYQEANEIASRLGLREAAQIFQDVELGPIYNWSSAEAYLSIIVNQGSISYRLDLLSQPELVEGKLASLEEIEMSALSFLENNLLSLPKEVKPKIAKSQYLKISGPDFLPVDFLEEANVAQIDFLLEIDDQMIFPSTPNRFPLTIRFGPKMRIIGLDFQSPFNSLESFFSYPLKSTSEVLEKIENLPQVSYLEFPERYLPLEEDYQQIQFVEFKEVKLGYYQPLVPENYLQPIFLFSGTARLKDGRIGNVYLYLSAIKENYFSTLEP